MYDKLDGCGTRTVELFGIEKQEFVEANVYCHNRSCESEDCKKHRLYLYLRQKLKSEIVDG